MRKTSIHEALDGIVYRTVLSFVAVAAATSAPLLLHLTPGVHVAAHAIVPAAWLAYAVVVWVRERGRPPVEADAWLPAFERDPGGARAAWIAAVSLPVGWAAAAIGLLAHHLSTTAGAAAVFGIDLPILAVAWFLATLAWRTSYRRVLADIVSAPTEPARPGHLPVSRG